ncbi:hypothetical protein MKC73_15195, partial [[Clostridium] innocuum]|nr:hypothetical protein [[Clostridium] innocuum]
YNIEKLFYQIISKKKSPLKQGLSSVGRLNSSLNFMVLTSKHGSYADIAKSLAKQEYLSVFFKTIFTNSFRIV